MKKRNKTLFSAMLCSMLFGFNISAAQEDLSKKVELLERKVETLEREKAKEMSPGFGEQIFGGLRFGAYGETRVRSQDSPFGQRNGFDASRIVLLPSFKVNDFIIFNSEIEFEHGGAAGAVDGDNKLFEGGNIEVEQLYIDFLINDHFNWRSPGVDLVPVGYINLHHEPTVYYSTDRPEIYRELIPSTWFEGATSIYGKIVDGLNYQVQINTGLEDNGATQEDGIPEPGITGKSGIRDSRPSIGDFNVSNNDFGYVTRLSYQPASIPGLAGSTSAYYSRVSPREAFMSPVVLGSSEVAIFDSELRYRMPGNGLELRGEYVHILLLDNQNLGANHDSDPINNTGEQMFGYNLEAAYHIPMNPWAGKNFDLVPFYRYSRIDLQSGNYQGTDVNLATGQSDRQFHTFGVAFFPVPQVVLKLDYRVALDESFFGPNSNKIQGAVGFFF